MSQIDRCSIEFGFQANVLKIFVNYVPRAVAAADYTPAIIEGEPALTAASLATLRLGAEKQRNKKNHQLKLSMPKIYATLWKSMSIESRRKSATCLIFPSRSSPRSKCALENNSETHITNVNGIGLGPLEIV